MQLSLVALGPILRPARSRTAGSPAPGPRGTKLSPDVISSILLARLALDRRLHGEGLGAQLLVDAVRIAGGRLIVVDAFHQRAASFYEHFGFRGFRRCRFGW